MKIIKEGNKELAITKRAKPVEFSCSLCGCIWQANKDEYENESNQYDGEIFYCDCPTCGEKIYSSKRIWVVNE